MIKGGSVMHIEYVQAWAAILNALAWPAAVLIVAIIIRSLVLPAISEGGCVAVKMQGVEFTVTPAQGLRPPGGSSEEDSSQLTRRGLMNAGISQKVLPFDYYFLNHTSFLRKEKQEEFRKLTGVDIDHYDIRVIVDSYYQDALERIDCVEYILHHAYPQPIQYRRNPEDKFMLKELANGEYVLMARVFLKDRKEPILLQRYITLWETGPMLN